MDYRSRSIGNSSVAQFDVFRVGKRQLGLAIDCQSDMVTGFETRLMAPLVQPGTVARPLPRLHPVVKIEDEEWVIATHLAAAVPQVELGPKLVSLANERDRIVAAFDVLLTGV